ncbi:YlxQ-related RNA-binding protein [Pilibacter termitis]|nr:YlxQ-related RNA-binding protein [Pilibacter termitis]
MNKERVLNLLGLAQRSRNLVTGEELVLEEIRRQKAKLVFIANDASENTKKKITDKSKTYEVNYNLFFSHQELSNAIGASRKVIAVTDKGFAKRMIELLVSVEGEFIE